MKIVKDKENFNIACVSGKFELHPDFNICILARYIEEANFYKLVESVPNYADFMRVAISNV